ncbi:MAG: TIGR00730 family Rossman fold protein, partial [Pseudomonas sp.]
WTWGQLGYHAKPLGLLDVNGFYTKLGDFLDHIVEEGFVRPQHRAMLLLEQQADALLDGMEQFVAPVVPKWVDKAPD